MRKTLYFTLVVVLTAGLSSCESIESLFDIDFDTTLSGDLDISIQESAKKSASYSFSTYTEVDPLDDEDIQEYLDKIKDFDVNEIMAKAVYVNKGEVVFGPGTTFTIYDNIDKATWPAPDNWAVSEGTTLTLGDISKVYQTVADILTRKKPFTIGASGTCSETGVEVVIRISIKTKVIANPL